jgi:hypothetical protein
MISIEVDDVVIRGGRFEAAQGIPLDQPLGAIPGGFYAGRPLTPRRF